MASPDQTLRYRAPDRRTYAEALCALVGYAREHPEPDFTFGPLRLEAIESSGLAVSGSDLSGVSEVMSRIPGLLEVPA